VAHLAEGFGFDLSNALASDFELSADFFESAGITISQAESQFQNFAFPF
jgi:hypothetical protein